MMKQQNLEEKPPLPRFEIWLRAARTKAECGNAERMEVYLNLAQRYAKMEIAEEARMIAMRGYQNSIPKEIEKAKLAEEKGYTRVAKHFWKRVEKCERNLEACIAESANESSARAYA